MPRKHSLHHCITSTSLDCRQWFILLVTNLTLPSVCLRRNPDSSDQDMFSSLHLSSFEAPVPTAVSTFCSCLTDVEPYSIFCCGSSTRPSGMLFWSPPLYRVFSCYCISSKVFSDYFGPCMVIHMLLNSTIVLIKGIGVPQVLHQKH